MTPATASFAPLALAKGPELVGRPESVKVLLGRAVARYPDEVALASLYQSSHKFPGRARFQNNNPNGQYHTFGQLHDDSESLAAALYTRGLRRGQPVATFLYNSVEFVLAFWTAAKLNVPFVPLDPKAVTRTAEVKHYLNVVKPAALIVADQELLEALEQNFGHEIRMINIKIVGSASLNTRPDWFLFHDVLEDAKGGSASAALAAIDEIDIDVEKDIAFIVFTSGTSGLPKACPHTNRNLWAAFMGDSSTRRLNSSHRLLQHLPASHIFGCLNMVVFWYNGASVIFPSKVFEAESSLIAIEQENCTHMGVVPSIVKALTSHPQFSSSRVKSLHHIGLGGTLISPEVTRICTDKNGFGAEIAVPGFGMSEGMPILAWTNNEELVVENGFSGVGRPVAGVQVKVCGVKSRECLLPGQVGELHIGGPIIINGYLTGENDNFYEKDGCHWLATGDEAKIDGSGAVFIFGRYKDIIIRGGENLSPAIIEACINTKIPTLTAQVIGIPDDIAGEVPAAVVQVPDGIQPNLDRIQAIVRADLGQSAVPEAIITLQELGETVFPTTTSGKVKKNKLRNMVNGYFERDKEKQSKSNSTSTEGAILSTLASLLGQPPRNLPRDTPLNALLDSISLMRFCDQIGKIVGKSVTIQDATDATNIQDLTQRIQLKATLQSGPHSTSSRPGPPRAADLIYGEGDQVVKTQFLVTDKLEQLGITWENDVENIYPVIGTSCFGWLKELAFSVQITALTQSSDAIHIRHALELSLGSWPLFRSIAVEYDPATRLFIILRGGKRVFDSAISYHHDVDNPDDLSKISIPADHDRGQLPKGLLFRAIIAKVTSVGRIGLVIRVNHAAYDNLSLAAWAEDFKQLIEGNHPTQHTPYKLFADAFYLHQGSKIGQMAINFHLQHLRGIGALRGFMWPGESKSKLSATEAPLQAYEDPSKRAESLSKSGSGQLVIVRRVPHLAHVGTALRVSASIVFKAAVSLFNTHKTGGLHALMGMILAGRIWPCIEGPLAQLLPSPLTIAGPTITGAVSITQIDPHENVNQMLTRMNEEQNELVRYQHRPMAMIAMLSGEDQAGWIGAMRQIFNWQPSDKMLKEDEGADPVFEIIQETMLGANASRGFVWEFGHVEPETVKSTTQWSLDQFPGEEVTQFVSSVFKIAEWLCDPNNRDEEVKNFKQVIED